MESKQEETIEDVPQESIVTICHTSDNHTYLSLLNLKKGLPPADILVVSGDFTEIGTEKEAKLFISDIEAIKSRYKHIIVILGNHEYRPMISETPKLIETLKACSCITLLQDSEVNLMGLRIYGVGYDTWMRNPIDQTPFKNIPEGIDVLVTHEPPSGILGGLHVGLSKIIEKVKPRYHLFGHMHGSYGILEKNFGNFSIIFSNAASKNDQDMNHPRPARILKIPVLKKLSEK